MLGAPVRFEPVTFTISVRRRYRYATRTPHKGRKKKKNKDKARNGRGDPSSCTEGNAFDLEGLKEALPGVPEESKVELEGEDDCAICLDGMVGGGKVVGGMVIETLLCGHHYHEQCVTRVIEHHLRHNKPGTPLCPTCRADLVRK